MSIKILYLQVKSLIKIWNDWDWKCFGLQNTSGFRLFMYHQLSISILKTRNKKWNKLKVFFCIGCQHSKVFWFQIKDAQRCTYWAKYDGSHLLPSTQGWSRKTVESSRITWAAEWDYPQNKNRQSKPTKTKKL